MSDGAESDGWEAFLQSQEQLHKAEQRIKHLEAYAKHERSLGAEGPMMELIGVRQNVGFFIKRLNDVISGMSSVNGYGIGIGELIEELERSVKPIMPPEEQP